MEVIATELADVKVVVAPRFEDPRGYLSEAYNERAFAEVGFDCNFVQENHSFSRAKGTVRGLHYQLPPFAQDKLVHVVRGAIRDVAVDVRKDSPTFGQHVDVFLSAENRRQMFVPAGFAHGFVTLEPDTLVVYKLSNYYAPDHQRGILWNDPALRIEWGVSVDEAVLSERDRNAPRLADVSELLGMD